MPYLNGDSGLNDSQEDGDLSSTAAVREPCVRHSPLAIVGMGCRFAGGATNPEELWKLLVEARSGWSKIPTERFNQPAFHHPAHDMSGTFNTCGGYFLKEDLAFFDAPFFSISPVEAKAMDPQQRLQLEVTYEAIENAGIPMEKLAGSDTSVFVATFNRDYERMVFRDPENQPLYSATGNGSSILSNRISYFFDLKGASFTIDTGCSGSLVAFHQACQSIRLGESRQAIVGGTNVILDPDVMFGMSNLQFFSDEGRCYTFDSRASGYGRGEGTAAIIIKSLDAALQDGNPIQAVIHSSVVNQDGRTLGITMPSRTAQEAAIEKAYAIAGLDYSETAYVEAHGTGTKAGDPIETGAIAATLASKRSSDAPLLIGSVKTNLGHTESTSGLAGVIKAILMINKGYIPPNLNFLKPNDDIPFEQWKLKVAQKLEPWPVGKPRRVSVNSFGYGGTNAHCILESMQSYLKSKPTERRHINGEATPEIDRGHTNGVVARLFESSAQLLVLSAASQSAATKLVTNTEEYICRSAEKQGSTALQDIAHTLYSHRSALAWRLSFTASTADDLLEQIRSNSHNPQKRATNPRVGFVFTGQGSQWANMARELIGAYPVFRDSISKAEQCLKLLGASWILTDELAKPPEQSQLGRAAISQPVCTAVQNALVDLLRSWNIKPAAVTGHSSGEISAAYACGALDFHSAMIIAYFRGTVVERLHEQSPHLEGAMLAAGLPMGVAIELISKIPPHLGKLVVACVNSPKSVTISGDRNAIEVLQNNLEAQQVFVRRLAVDTAYHSYHMEEVASAYSLALSKVVKPSTETSAVFVSSVTGEPAKPSELDHVYWVRNLTSQVRFSDALSNLCRSSLSKNTLQGDLIDTLIEIGPHSALAGPVKQTLAAENYDTSLIKYIPSLVRHVDGINAMLNMAGEIFVKGLPIDIDAVNNPNSTPRYILTDMSPYPWDHAVSHWHETRLSKGFRNRASGRHYLLGSPSADQNALEPSWRNYLRVSENPWLQGHKVQSNIVLPATAYIMMAIEAAEQTFISHMLSNSPPQGAEDRTVRYLLREINIGRALVIPTSAEGVEIKLALRSYNVSLRAPSESWHEFVVFSYNDRSQWIEHCRGLISAEQQPTAEEVESDRPDLDMGWEMQTRITEADRVCSKTIDPQDMYKRLRGLGLEYEGPFTSVERILTNAEKASGVVRIPDTAAEMPKAFEQPHVLHPATLDACLHLVFAPLWELGDSLEPMVPTHIAELSMSRDFSNRADGRLRVYSHVVKNRTQNVNADLLICKSAVEDAKPSPLVEISGITLTNLSDGGGRPNEDPSERNMASTMQWKLHSSSLRLNTFKEVCSADLPVDLPSEKLSYSQEASLHFIHSAMSEMSNFDMEAMKPHHRRYYDWMRETLSTRANHDILSDTDAVTARMKSYGADGEMLSRIGSNIVPIMKGEMEPLGLMMEDDLLNRTYKSDSMNRLYGMMSSYVELLGFQQPEMSVLEVGAGTGGATVPTLEALSNSDLELGYAHHFSRYVFTDISSGFFEKAEELLQPWKNMIDFRRLDIESQPSLQGFTEGAHDLILACNVLHATSKISETLKNVRSLLKTGAKLILLEDTRPNIPKSLIFGTLPGWWLGTDDGRIQSPYLSLEGWSSALADSGFSGVELWMGDYETSEDWRGTMMVATAIESVPESSIPEVEVLYRDNVVGLDSSMLGELSSSLTSSLGHSKSSFLREVEVDSKFYISLVDIEDPVLQQCSSDQFNAIKKLIFASQGVLWVTRGATMESSYSAASLFNGLARTARSENPALKLFTLDLDPNRPLTDTTAAEIINQVFKTALASGTSDLATDMEFAERDGKIYVPRVIGSRAINDFLRASRSNPEPVTQPFFQAERPLRLFVSQPGIMDSVMFIHDNKPLGTLGPDEIKAETRAIGVNFRDVMIALGQIGGQSTFLGESSGVVTEVGANMKAKFSPGDHICFTTDQGYSSKALVAGRRAVRIPSSMSFEDAASLQISHTTAYYSIVHRARLRAGESILIHSAAGALGQAAIMLSQHLGAGNIFVTVGTAKKKQFLVDTYGIPEGHIFSSRRTTFVSNVKRLTDGHGVDVVLNSLAGEGMRETLKTLAHLGRFLELGKRDATVNTRIEMSMLSQNISYFFIDLAAIQEYDGGLYQEILHSTFELLEKGVLRPVTPITVMPIAEYEGALRKFQSGKQIGKIVLQCQPDAQVKVLPKAIEPPPFRSDATYLIAGGVGGLGREMCRWMTRSGVKNLIIVSRSGLGKESAQSLAKDLEDVGVKFAAAKCDIGNLTELQEVMAPYKATMPPIRGVIQSALVLKDSILENMTASDYHTVYGPKVLGTNNLLTLLNTASLDFFITLSSAAGIVGNRGQSNYASVSNFQDAFARHHHSKHHSQTIFRTLDLGEIESAGYVVENAASVKLLFERSAFRVTLDEFLATLTYAMSSRPASLDESQIILGLPPVDPVAVKNQTLALPWLPTDAKFSHLRHRGNADGLLADTSADPSSGTRAALRAAASLPEASEIVTKALIAKTAKIMAVSQDDVLPDRTFSSYGADSLVAVELRNWIGRELEAGVQILDILGGKTVGEVAQEVVSRSKLVVVGEKGKEIEVEETRGPQGPS